MSTIISSTLPSLHGGSLKITLTVPLKVKRSKLCWEEFLRFPGALDTNWLSRFTFIRCLEYAIMNFELFLIFYYFSER